MRFAESRSRGIRSESGPSRRVRAAVLGATGAVGQKLVRLLADHPWFEISSLVASERSAGRPYGKAVHWLEAVPLPAAIAQREVVSAFSEPDFDVAFSGLDSATALELEPRLLEAGIAVVSNAGAFRMQDTVPLVVPEVNPGHLGLVTEQPPGQGLHVTNPNCSTIGLVLALKPLVDAFGVETVLVTTMQAVSGAGYPGVASLDILGNVIPTIRGEEEKLETEPKKILGILSGGRVSPAALRISAQTNRVAVVDGHTLSISVALSRPASLEEVREALGGFESPLTALRLPSAPARPLVWLDGDDAPQPRLHAGLGDGMSVSVGHLKPCKVLDYRFVALVHNTVRGAAGAALLNAELMVAQGLLGPRRGSRPARVAELVHALP